MIDKDFYKNFGPFSLSELASKINAKICGDKNKEVLDIASLSDANSLEISFYHSSKYKEDFNKTKAGVIVIDKSTKTSSNKNYLIVDDPYVGMAKIASIFYPDCEYPNFYFDENELINSLDNSIKCSKNVCIHKDSRIGKNRQEIDRDGAISRGKTCNRGVNESEATDILLTSSTLLKRKNRRKKARTVKNARQ